MRGLFSVRGWLSVTVCALALTVVRPANPLLGFVIDATLAVVVAAGWLVVSVQLGAEEDEVEP